MDRDVTPEDLVSLPPHERTPVLRGAIARSHAHHMARNAAYRRTLLARGVPPDPDDPLLDPAILPLLLRPASLTFKSYVETLGPFPQEEPGRFIRWLADQISLPLPPERGGMLRRSYRSLESFLTDIERVYGDMGLEMVTSSGTSGRASVVPRDADTMRLAVRAFFAGIAAAWGIDRGTALIFVMPRETRVAMARTAVIGTRELDWATDAPVHFTVPFAATPDRMRLRAGRTFHPGARGSVERRVLHPLMVRADRRQATRRYIALTLDRLRECAGAGRPLLLLGGLSQLHAVALEAGRVELPRGSRVATGGGLKDDHPYTPAQVRADLAEAFPGTPVSDVYGLAEANWAAFECPRGNYHIPAWVHAVVTDDADQVVPGPDATGLLAFFDPVGGGSVIPPFFQTADRVRLVNGGGEHEPGLGCECGRDTAYIAGPVRRVDLMEEAGCAAQL